MKCPFRFKEFTTDEADQECVDDCAMLVHCDVEATDTHWRDVFTCGLLGKHDRPKNKLHGEWHQRGAR